MSDARTPGKWPYRAAKPARMRRVIKLRENAARQGASHGVQRREKPQPRFVITRLQARLALALAVFAMIATGGWYAYHSPWLTVQRVTVTGTSKLSEDQVRSLAHLDGVSGFSVDTAGAQARIAALPEIRSATVTQNGWNAVAIKVEERVPWGSWQINGIDVPIDVDGYVLAAPALRAGSPVILEIDPQRVINIGDRLDPGAVQLAARLVRESQTAFGRDVLGLVYRQSSGLTVVFSGATVDEHAVWVTFGDSRDYDYKVGVLYALFEQAKQTELDVSVVDLRFGDRLSFH